MSTLGESKLQNVKVGDIVTRFSYNHDIYFKVSGICTGKKGKQYALLKGLDIRLEATAPLDDLLIAGPAEICCYWQQCQLEQIEKVECILNLRKKRLLSKRGEQIGIKDR